MVEYHCAVKLDETIIADIALPSNTKLDVIVTRLKSLFEEVKLNMKVVIQYGTNELSSVDTQSINKIAIAQEIEQKNFSDFIIQLTAPPQHDKQTVVSATYTVLERTREYLRPQVLEDVAEQKQMECTRTNECPHVLTAEILEKNVTTLIATTLGENKTFVLVCLNVVCTIKQNGYAMCVSDVA